MLLSDNRTQFVEPPTRQFASQLGEILFGIFGGHREPRCRTSADREPACYAGSDPCKDRQTVIGTVAEELMKEFLYSLPGDERASQKPSLPCSCAAVRRDRIGADQHAGRAAFAHWIAWCCGDLGLHGLEAASRCPAFRFHSGFRELLFLPLRPARKPLRIRLLRLATYQAGQKLRGTDAIALRVA